MSSPLDKAQPREHHRLDGQTGHADQPTRVVLINAVLRRLGIRWHPIPYSPKGVEQSFSEVRQRTRDHQHTYPHPLQHRPQRSERSPRCLQQPPRGLPYRLVQTYVSASRRFGKEKEKAGKNRRVNGGGLPANFSTLATGF
jgi:hypothetical protein